MDWHLFDLLRLACIGYANEGPHIVGFLERVQSWLEVDKELPRQRSVAIPTDFLALDTRVGPLSEKRTLRGKGQSSWRDHELSYLDLARHGVDEILRLDASGNGQLACRVSQLMERASRLGGARGLRLLLYRDFRGHWNDLSGELRTSLARMSGLSERCEEWGEAAMYIDVPRGLKCGFQAWSEQNPESEACRDLFTILAKSIDAPSPSWDHETTLAVGFSLKDSLVGLPLYAGGSRHNKKTKLPHPLVGKILKVAIELALTKDEWPSDSFRRDFGTAMAAFSMLLYGNLRGAEVLVPVTCERLRSQWSSVDTSVRDSLLELSGLPEDVSTWQGLPVHLSVQNLLDGVMMYCRHAGDPPNPQLMEILRRAATIMEGQDDTVRRYVEVTLQELSWWYELAFYRGSVHFSVAHPDEVFPPSPALSRLVELLKMSIHQLAVFEEQKDRGGLRGLGYAVHFVPGILSRPEKFSPSAFNFGVKQIPVESQEQMHPELRRVLRELVS